MESALIQGANLLLGARGEGVMSAVVFRRRKSLGGGMIIWWWVVPDGLPITQPVHTGHTPHVSHTVPMAALIA